MTMELVKNLALEVAAAGGRALLVGGCVRDEILGLSNKDYDVEVYGLTSEKLLEVLQKFGKVDAVGASFAVYKLGQDIDVSLPRREKKVGEGHKGFEVTGDPFMSFEEACSRRDFTINAIMKDPLTGEVIDPLSGAADLDARTLRAVSDKTFQEDSLRVLRLVQFASRFDFDVEDKTFRMALSTDLSDLPKERVWMEVEKMLMKSANPSVGVLHLESLNIFDKLFPNFTTYNGMFEGLRKAPHFCNDLSYEEKLTVLLSVFCWATDVDHLDEVGFTSVNGYNVRKRVEEILLHAPYKVLQTDEEFYKLAEKVSMKLLTRVMYSLTDDATKIDYFAEAVERLGIGEEPLKPVVTGKYLVEQGMTPSKEMGELLRELYEYQMQGWVNDALFHYARAKCEVEDVPVD